MKRLLSEILVFLALAIAVALAANAARANGLELGRDYFPADSVVGDGAGGAPVEDGASPLAAELAAAGLTAIRFEEFEEFLPYVEGIPGNEDSGYFLIDARNEKAFEQGHIPGAMLCDHYRQDVYLDEALIERLKRAALVVVYCNGGDCPDSLSLARDLVYEHKVSPEIVRVYEGGWDEFKALAPPGNGE